MDGEPEQARTGPELYPAPAGSLREGQRAAEIAWPAVLTRAGNSLTF